MDPQKVTFFTCSQKPHSFDTNLESFIGPYRDYSAPAAVTAGTCFNSISRRTNGTGAFCHELTLEGNSSSELIFILGFSSEPDKIAGMVKPYLQSEQSRDAYKRLRQYWQNYTSKLQVKTPDADMNLFVNTWNQYQCKTTYNWSRFVSLYQLGFARGMGVRDSSQDILGVMHTIPKKARQKISRLLQCQYPEGKSYHLYFPLSGKGGEGDAPVKKYDWYSDDHLWLVLATNSYLKESGDMDFLKEKIPFNDSSDDSVAVHLHKAVSFTAAHLGPHQLALAGRADWNDGLNLDTGRGIAESIFTSLLYMRALRELIELYTYLKDDTTAAQYTAMYDKMKKAVNNAGWDGKWFLRAYDDQGNKLGSAACKRGQIFVNPQSWAVFSGAADIKQGNMILDAVDKKLNTPYGIVILEPAYQKFDANIGGLTTYPPGAKENGGIFCHTNPWVMIAAAMLGRGEDAFR
ncbi:MAG TPA: glycosyl transferase, partial [Spirochaetota bacterium]|nr:glycosyl transferase [Spirochaetota bacterium]